MSCVFKNWDGNVYNLKDVSAIAVRGSYTILEYGYGSTKETYKIEKNYDYEHYIISSDFAVKRAGLMTAEWKAPDLQKFKVVKESAFVPHTKRLFISGRKEKEALIKQYMRCIDR